MKIAYKTFLSNDAENIERQIEQFNHDRLILEVRYEKGSEYWIAYVAYIDL